MYAILWHFISFLPVYIRYRRKTLNLLFSEHQCRFMELGEKLKKSPEKTKSLYKNQRKCPLKLEKSMILTDPILRSLLNGSENILVVLGRTWSFATMDLFNKIYTYNQKSKQDRNHHPFGSLSGMSRSSLKADSSHCNNDRNHAK